ncbi:MAG: hydroxypyruvate isomerase [Gammaproteobacteria bacterium]|nr:hydroxypyruvate isomerase [Gammaproteobacteria bacterium]
MPHFAANLTMLYTEIDFLSRFGAAAKAGFKGVEYLFPYAFDEAELRDRLDKHGLVQVLHNLPAGDWDAGERGIACHPDRVGEFQDGVALAIEYATELGCTQLNCLAGIVPPSANRERVDQTFIDNLKFAAQELKQAGIRLLTEPINTRDIPGFYLTHTRQAIEIIDVVATDNLFLQYDIYHMQIMEGDLAHTIEAYLDRIAHMQLADNPGRHEPGSGEINYPFLFRFVDDLQYPGWIGCEYKPDTTTDAGLTWLDAYR